MRPLFASPVEAVLFWGVLVVAFAPVVIWSARHRKARGKRRQDLLSLIMLAMIADVAIGYARIGGLPHWLFYLGETLFVVGAAFTAWSYSLLGRYLSLFVEVLPDHELIEDGPYRYIRNPGYLGAIVALTGFGLALQSWVALVVILTIAAYLLAYRIRLEEQVMATELGDRYAEYTAKTKRFIPFIW